ncbi:Crp/Fnr family transcriptional regulator [Aeromonas cavernicola]|uniref:Crp/Fnr family transcriptional regulator n=1 Tax=Aeromonas cavernicola TaxID=1006623 RepID=A0A2H9U5M7_9GAMM|nr:Crp/Fnr family transcriptional regulator [Aeromonas cavernicola]PJG59289.1 Crp/Fnr family transcriptional regulator [Aeromonas cavernicola]
MQQQPYPLGRFHTTLQQLEPRFAAALDASTLFLRRYLPGESIMQQGELSEQLYLVKRGRVSLNSTVHSGRSFQLGDIECHDQIFGEMEFFSTTPVQWNVVAETELDAHVICAHKLAKRLLAEPELALFFATALACDYLDTLEITTSRLLHPICYNIALELWRERQRTPMLGSRKRAREAARFGTTERVYRRALKELVEQGIIYEGDSGPAIADLTRLRAYLDL